MGLWLTLPLFRLFDGYLPHLQGFPNDPEVWFLLGFYSKTCSVPSKKLSFKIVPDWIRQHLPVLLEDGTSLLDQMQSPPDTYTGKTQNVSSFFQVTLHLVNLTLKLIITTRRDSCLIAHISINKDNEYILNSKQSRGFGLPNTCYTTTLTSIGPYNLMKVFYIWNISNVKLLNMSLFYISLNEYLLLFCVKM